MSHSIGVRPTRRSRVRPCHHTHRCIFVKPSGNLAYAMHEAISNHISSLSFTSRLPNPETRPIVSAFGTLCPQDRICLKCSLVTAPLPPSNNHTIEQHYCIILKAISNRLFQRIITNCHVRVDSAIRCRCCCCASVHTIHPPIVIPTIPYTHPSGLIHPSASPRPYSILP